MNMGICQFCDSKEKMERKRSFLGFEKWTCLNCGRYLECPLSSGYNLAYWILGVISGIALVRIIPMLIKALGVGFELFMNILAEHSLFILGLVGAIWALTKDAQLRKSLPKNLKNQDTSGWMNPGIVSQTQSSIHESINTPTSEHLQHPSDGEIMSCYRCWEKLPVGASFFPNCGVNVLNKPEIISNTNPSHDQIAQKFDNSNNNKTPYPYKSVLLWTTIVFLIGFFGTVVPEGIYGGAAAGVRFAVGITLVIFAAPIIAIYKYYRR